MASCFFEKGGCASAKMGERGLWPGSLTTARARGHTESDPLATRTLGFYVARIVCLRLRTGSAIFHTCWVYVWENDRHNNGHILAGSCTYADLFLKFACIQIDIYMYERKNSMLNCSAHILPGRFEEISELEMGHTGSSENGFFIR